MIKTKFTLSQGKADVASWPSTCRFQEPRSPKLTPHLGQICLISEWIFLWYHYSLKIFILGVKEHSCFHQLIFNCNTAH